MTFISPALLISLRHKRRTFNKFRSSNAVRHTYLTPYSRINSALAPKNVFKKPFSSDLHSDLFLSRSLLLHLYVCQCSVWTVCPYACPALVCLLFCLPCSFVTSPRTCKVCGLPLLPYSFTVSTIIVWIIPAAAAMHWLCAFRAAGRHKLFLVPSWRCDLFNAAQI